MIHSYFTTTNNACIRRSQYCRSFQIIVMCCRNNNYWARANNRSILSHVLSFIVEFFCRHSLLAPVSLVAAAAVAMASVTSAISSGSSGHQSPARLSGFSRNPMKLTRCSATTS